MIHFHLIIDASNRQFLPPSAGQNVHIDYRTWMPIPRARARPRQIS